MKRLRTKKRARTRTSMTRVRCGGESNGDQE